MIECYSDGLQMELPKTGSTNDYHQSAWNINIWRNTYESSESADIHTQSTFFEQEGQWIALSSPTRRITAPSSPITGYPIQPVFHLSVLDWDSIASYSMRSNGAISLLTRPIILIEQQQVVFGTHSLPLENSMHINEVFAVSFSSLISTEAMSNQQPLTWTGYISKAAVSDIERIESNVVAATLADGTLCLLQVESDQLRCVESVATIERQTREMSYDAIEKLLWFGGTKGLLLGMDMQVNQCTCLVSIGKVISSIRIPTDMFVHLVTVTTDSGMFYGYDTRQNQNSNPVLQWNGISSKQNMYSHDIDNQGTLVIGYGDGTLCVTDIRSISSSDTLLQTNMNAIGHVRHHPSYLQQWLLFGASCAMWTIHPGNSSSAIAARQWALQLKDQRFHSSFYGIQGECDYQ